MNLRVRVFNDKSPKKITITGLLYEPSSTVHTKYVYGTFDENTNDIGIPDIYVTLKNNQTGEYYSKPTDSNGIAVFNGLVSGTKYTIYETLQNLFGINADESFFNNMTINQPVLNNSDTDLSVSVTSTTPRKYIFTAENTSYKNIDFGHQIYKPIRCHYKGYIVTRGDNSENTNLIEIGLQSGKINILTRYLNLRLNALAYNIKEELLYSMPLTPNPDSSTKTNWDWQKGLYRIDGNNMYSELFSIINSSDNTIWNSYDKMKRMSIGTCDNNGNYYVSYIASQDVFDRYFYKINLNPLSLNYLYITPLNIINFGSWVTSWPSIAFSSYTIADWSYNNTTNKLYAYVDTDLADYIYTKTPKAVDKMVEFSLSADGNTLNAKLYNTDISSITDYSDTRARTMVGVYGYDNGFIYLMSATGKIYEVNTNQIYNMKLKQFSNMNSIFSNGDGANCSCASNMLDYGNAPESNILNTASYKSLLASGGPRHSVSKKIYIGDLVYAENDAVIGPTAVDNDGISYPLNDLDKFSSIYHLNVKCYNNTNYPGRLYAWLDFNTDGKFDVNESVVYDVPSIDSEQTINVEFIRPANYISTLNKTFIRLRLTTEELLLGSASGNNEDPRSLSQVIGAIDGEVEDYLLNITQIPYVICSKTSDKTTVYSGDDLTYTVTVTNYGSKTANSVTIKDILPPEVYFISGSYIKNSVVYQLTFSELLKGIDIGSLSSFDGPVVFTINTKVI